MRTYNLFQIGGLPVLPTKLNSLSIRMFSREPCIWITLEYAKNPSPNVKREYVRKYNIFGRQKNKYCPHNFTRVFERFKSRPSALSRKSHFQSNSSSKAANKPKNTGEHHLFNPSNHKKVNFFQCYYSQNSTKGTKSKAIQVSQMSRIESHHKQQCLAFCNWICNVGTAHSPGLSPLAYWFWGAMD